MNKGKTAEAIIRDYVEQLVKLADQSLKLYDQFTEEFDLDDDTEERIQDITRDICDGSRSDVEELVQEISDEIALDDPDKEQDFE